MPASHEGKRRPIRSFNSWAAFVSKACALGPTTMATFSARAAGVPSSRAKSQMVPRCRRMVDPMVSSLAFEMLAPLSSVLRDADQLVLRSEEDPAVGDG